MKYLLALLLLFPSLCLSAESLQVKVLGVKGELKDNVLFYLDIEKQKKSDELSVRWIKRLYEKGPEQIRAALQPFGYYNPVIGSSLNKVEDKWVAQYQIEPGAYVRVESVDISWEGSGADNPDLMQEELDVYPLAVGDQLYDDKHESGKEQLLDKAFSKGYAKAKIKFSQIEVDPDSNTADITIVADTGPLYYFGEVHFKQDFLNPELLQHYNTIETGEPYSYTALLEFQQNLIASNYAREVTIDPLFASAQDNRVPLDVIMKPVAPHKLAFGLGYETDIGVRGTMRWTDRLINRYGHQSEVYLKLAQKERILSGEYFIPVLNPLTDRWVNSVRYEYEETPSTVSDKYLLETAIVRRNLDDTLFYKLFVNYAHESFKIGVDPSTETKLLTLGGTMRFSRIDEDLYPQHGYFAFADLRGASDALISDISFLRLNTKGRYLFGFGENGRLEFRGEIGAAWVNDFEQYPNSLRYFAGGDSSVRGYEYQSLGPENSDGIVVGGKNLLVGSVEYDHRVAEKWVVAGFVDAGNAYNEKLDKLYVGAGVGFRWLAPFGALRIDFAWPVSESPEASDVRLHLGFGATL
jgi:translocation and assembly module TamA